MGAVVVARDVACDTTAGPVEGFVVVQPHLAFFQFPEPAFDEGLGFGVAVAAASVADTLLGQARLEAAGGEGRAVVRAERQLALLDPIRGGAASSTSVIASSARQRTDRCHATSARVQQSMIAIRYVQPCSPTQILVNVELPETGGAAQPGRNRVVSCAPIGGVVGSGCAHASP